MTVKERTQVGIVGAGPAGLLLSHLLALGGIDSRVIEVRSRAHCEARQRAGMLEPATAQLLRDAGLGRRLDAEGLEHDGIYLQFAGERHRVNFRELAGRRVTIYPQTEIVRDLIQARDASGDAPEFGVADTEIADLDGDRPTLRYIDPAGRCHEVSCDAIAGCDGFRGICRPAIPAGSLRSLAQRTYPFAWLGILAQAPPSTDQVIYCRHDRGFALHSMRTPETGRLYLAHGERHASGQTVAAYRGTWRLLLAFAAEHAGKQPSGLDVADTWTRRSSVVSWTTSSATPLPVQPVSEERLQCWGDRGHGRSSHKNMKDCGPARPGAARSASCSPPTPHARRSCSLPATRQATGRAGTSRRYRLPTTD
jgi:2-polyprenyl-6-methoxyphenol hydroxylase-like FAD-dependent oxidoreductase